MSSIAIGQNWYGDLTYENIERVSCQLNTLLSQGKFFWISRRLVRIDEPTGVYPSLSLDPADSRSGRAVKVSDCCDDKTGVLYHKSIILHTTYGVHFFQTKLEKGWNKDADPKLSDHFSFSNGDRVSIRTCAPCGDTFQNIFVLENRYEERCPAESVWKYLAQPVRNDPKLLEDLEDTLKWAGYPKP